MLCQRGFCIVVSPGDIVEKLCKVFWVTSEWKKDVHILQYKSPKKSVFVPSISFEWKVIICQWRYLENVHFHRFQLHFKHGYVKFSWKK